MKLVFLIGDAAVSKMTVGQELMKITDLRLFHNHMTIEPETINGGNIVKKVCLSLKKRYVLSCLFVLVIIIALLTNPTKEDYMSFRNKQGVFLKVYDKAGNTVVKIERVNFYIFSTYTPFFYVEPGMTHLGVFGHFIQISDGQFDYPRWLELFD